MYHVSDICFYAHLLILIIKFCRKPCCVAGSRMSAHIAFYIPYSVKKSIVVKRLHYVIVSTEIKRIFRNAFLSDGCYYDKCRLLFDS